MLYRLGSIRVFEPQIMKNLINHRKFIINSASIKIFNQHTTTNLHRFTTCCGVKYNSQKLDGYPAQKQTGLINDSISKFKSNPYVRLMRLDRPIGSWLLFWPCSWSIALAAAPSCLPDISTLALFGAGAVIMRGAGCTINDMWDKDIDAKVQRTSTRPLVTKELTQLDALVFLSTQLGAGLLILLQLNWNSILLGASSLGLVIVYPLMKRITNWPQLVLGMTFNWGALLGYSAVQGHVLWTACLPLYAAGVCWTIIYDTIYAHQDRVDDLIVGVKSTALRFGKDTKKWLTCFAGLMTSSLVTTGLVCDMTWPYYASISIIVAHIGHQIFTLNIDNPADCAEKFMSNNYVGLILFMGVTLGILLQDPDHKASHNEAAKMMLQSLAPKQQIVQLQQK